MIRRPARSPGGAVTMVLRSEVRRIVSAAGDFITNQVFRWNLQPFEDGDPERAFGVVEGKPDFCQTQHARGSGWIV